MSMRGYLALFSLALIWGASFFFIKIGVAEMSPPTLVSLRLTFSLVVLTIVTLSVRGSLSGFWRALPLGIVSGFFNIAAPYLLITWGETQIDSSTASILNAAVPLFIVPLAAFWIGPGHERITSRRVLGVLIGFAGVLTIFGPAALFYGKSIIGDLAVLLAAAMYAIGGLLLRRYHAKGMLVGPISTQLTALLMVAPVIFLTGGLPTKLPSLGALAAVATLGVVGTGIAYLLFFWLNQNVGPTRASIVTYLLPCTAIIYGAVLLHESITPAKVGGLVLVLFGTLIITGAIRLPRRGKRQQPAMDAPASPVEEIPAALARVGGDA